ncbi:N-acetyltransferase [Clostridium chromiireducens]|uniref:N-acetyltransferase n=1 Tax=Clostridium chromiireducens TaxID=225345 RepID=A0A399IR44_9CLOT|nr:GNAT family N-acetyltransferase [Clostridium chromiireducens]RII35481.1 N-acetyltransferase [Clostridium chromiireducens]
MEQIIESKSLLKNKQLLSVLAESVYNPTEDRLNNRADKYISNQNTVVFSLKNNETYKGIIVLNLSNIKEIIILDIAVLNSIQKSGIGSSLINHCINIFEPNEIIAETDDDAVGFYKKFGFNIQSLGNKYGVGIKRYKCTFKCKL